MKIDYKTENRLQWVDVAKGIAILMVMRGHTVVKHDSVYRWITAFHVPTFLVITGYLYGVNNKQNYDTRKNAMKLVKLYLVFSMISYCTDFAYEYLSLKSVHSAFRIVGIDIYKTVALYGVHALWYLPAYVLSSKLFFSIKNRINYLIVLLMVFVGIAFDFLSPYVKDCIPSSVYMLVSIPIVTVVRALVCTVFIILGFAISKWGVKQFSEKNIWIRCGISCLLLVMSFTTSLTNTESNLSIVSFGKNPLCFFLSAILGSVGLMALSSVIQPGLNVLQYFGRNSLILLVTHHSLKFTFLARFITSSILSEESFAFGLIALLFLTVAEALIVEICNTKFRRLFS